LSPLSLLQVSQFSSEAGSHQNFFIALLPAAGALGRFLGPLLFGATVTFSQTDPSFCNPNFNYQRAYSMGDSYISNALTSTRRCSLSNVCLLMFPQDFITGVRGPCCARVCVCVCVCVCMCVCMCVYVCV
jgi:hypothetical protein